MEHFTIRPSAGEFHRFYAGYVAAVPDGDVVRRMETELQTGLAFYAGLPPAVHSHRYAEDKWSVRQVLGHVVDTERVFSYRAMCIARGDHTPLPSMDQNDYMAGADFESRSWQSLTGEYEHLRRANLALFASFDDETLNRRGVASGYDVSVRALLWIVAGHEIHHRKVLRERYL